MSIQLQLDVIQDHIRLACERANRNPEEITLIAVSKTQPEEVMKEAYQAGIRVFGENKVQELTNKYTYMPEDISWHMIGHLQTNKVKQVVGKASLIHSVDSLRVAEAIAKESVKRGIVSDVLIEVNVAEEESKFGFSCQEVSTVVRTISAYPGIHVCGLMTIAPFVDNSEENRAIFSVLRELSVDIKAQNIDNVNMDVLSMGMTNDYEVAIEEGATMIRVGTGLFGERDYKR